MSFSHKQKKYLKKNLQKKPFKVLVKDLGTTEKELELYLRKKKKFGFLDKLKKGKIAKEGLNNPKKLIEHGIKNRYFFILLIFLCFAAYFNVLNGEFVSDDIPTLVKNDKIGDLWGDLSSINFLQAIKSTIFLIFGFNPFVYHLVNLFFHLLNTWLVYFFILLVVKKKKVAVFTSLLFSLHPVNTEVVSWISGGGYSLASAFFLSSFIFYHFYLNNRKKLGYLLWVGLGYLLAMSTTAWAAPLIAVYLVYEILWHKGKINYYFYLVLVGAVVFNFLFVGRQTLAHREAALTKNQDSPFHDITKVIPLTLVEDFSLLAWPRKLSLFRDQAEINTGYLLFSRLLTLVFLFGLPFFLRKNKHFLFFFLFFLISVSVSLSPIQITSGVAERYLYLGSLSFCVLVAFLLIELERRFKIKKLSLILLIFLLSAYFVRVYLRNQEWRSSAVLWQATVKMYPQSWRAHNSLGNVFFEQKDWDKAIEKYSKANQLDSQAAEPLYNLGVSYLEKKDWIKTEQYLLEALKINPQDSRAFYSLGVVKARQADFEAAKPFFIKALEFNPDYGLAQKALQNVERELSKKKKP